MNEKRLQAKFWVFVLILSAVLVAGAAFFSTQVFAKPKLPPEKVHQIHLGPKVGLECTQCHEAYPKDNGVMTIPSLTKTCSQCHEKIADMGFEQGKPARRPINFSHAPHVEYGKKCVDCHKGAEPGTIATAKHPQCTECHKDDFEGMLCAKCHYDFAAMGLKKLSSYKHANDFMSRHAEYARKSAQACVQCHSETFCLDCHSKHEGLKPSLKYPERVRANLIHRGDWITMHRIEAKVDSSSCLKCHVTAECNTCHASRGVSSSTKDFSKLAFSHPPGWATNTNSKDFHGKAAREDIVSCAGCHNRGGPGDCRTCHAASKGLNPHPKGWDPQGRSMSDKMCAGCHSH